MSKVPNVRIAPERLGPSAPEPSWPQTAEGLPQKSDVTAPGAGGAAAVPAEGARSGHGGAAEPGIPKNSLDMVLAYLLNVEGSCFRYILADWMIAAVATGVRPHEWQSTHFEIFEDSETPDNDWIALFVTDPAKANAAGRPILRTVDVTPLDDETILAIMRTSEHLADRHKAGEFKCCKIECEELLNFACGEIFRQTGPGPKKSYSLDSLRQQFVANASSVKNLDEAGTLAGLRLPMECPESLAELAKAWDAEDLPEFVGAVKKEVEAHNEANRGKDRHTGDAAGPGDAKRHPTR